MAMEKKRKAWISALLSSIVPGSGQLYNGNLPLAIKLGIISIIFYTLASSLLLLSFTGLLLSVLFACVLSIYAICQAWIESRRLGVMRLKAWQKKRWYILFLVATIALPELLDFVTPSSQRFATFSIPSGSMIPTLLVGDYVMADTWAFAKREPERGEVTVFQFPKDHETRYVKRMIGLPGDMVEIKQGDLYVNGKKIEETPAGLDSEEGVTYQLFTEHFPGHDFVIRKRVAAPGTEGQDRENFGPITVPTGHYFALGDNRDRSNDSRYWGFIAKNELIGKMRYLYFSFDKEMFVVRRERIGAKIF